MSKMELDKLEQRKSEIALNLKNESLSAEKINCAIAEAELVDNLIAAEKIQQEL